MGKYNQADLTKILAGVGGLQLPPEHIGYYGSHTFCLAKKNKYALQSNTRKCWTGSEWEIIKNMDAKIMKLISRNNQNWKIYKKYNLNK